MTNFIRIAVVSHPCVTLPWRCGAAAAIDLLIQLYLFHSTFTAAIIQSRWRRRALRPSRAQEMMLEKWPHVTGCGCRRGARSPRWTLRKTRIPYRTETISKCERVNVAWGRSRFEVSRARVWFRRREVLAARRRSLCSLCLRNGVTLPNFWQLPVLRTLAYTLFGRFQNKSRTCSKSQAARVVYNDVQKSGIIGQHRRRRSKRATWKCPRKNSYSCRFIHMRVHYDENLTSKLWSCFLLVQDYDLNIFFSFNLNILPLDLQGHNIF